MPAPEIEVGEELARLERDGLVRADGARYRTTRRWQGAMARAAASLRADPAARFDLRIPIVMALIELYGQELADDELTRLVHALLRIEATELGPAPRPPDDAEPASATAADGDPD